MGCGPASSRSALLLTDPVLPHEFELDLWTRHLPGTYRPYPRLERHIEMLLTTILVLGLNRCWIACRHLVQLLPSPRTVAESQDRRRLQHLTRILTARCVHIQVPPRSGRLLRWFMVLGNFYKNSPLHFAMHTVNLSRHGHRVSWMRWCDGRKTRIPGPPIRPLLGFFKSPLRKSSRHGRSIGNSRLAARNAVVICSSDHRRTKWQAVAACSACVIDHM